MLATLESLLLGVPWTIGLTVFSFLIGALLGLPLCGMRLSQSAVLRFIGTGIVLVLRSIPPIVWLFFIFFGIGFEYMPLSPFAAAVLGLSLITAANMAEIYRGALKGIHYGQFEAATVLNFSARHRFFDIIGPQLLRIALPSMATYAIGLLKDSAVASVLGVSEIAFQAYSVSQQTFRGLEVYAIAALLYIGMSLPVAYVTRRMDLRMRSAVAR